MKKKTLIMLGLASALVFNFAFGQVMAATPRASIENASGQFAGDYYYDLYWYNETFPGWNYEDEYSTYDLLWLNNGTEDTWVMVVIEVNMTINETGQTNYLSFNIFDDPDNSFLGGWEDDWESFEDVSWEEYDDYYEDTNPDAWDWEEDPEDPEEWSNLTDVPGDYDWDAEYDWDDWDEGIASSPEGNAEGYSTMEESMTGDEGFWFMDIYFEEWATEFSGSYIYTWYNVEISEVGEIQAGSLLDPSTLGPATTSPYGEIVDPENPEYPLDDWWYDWDWEWAQMMMENVSYDQESYSYMWFSYDIGQWVSWYDNNTDQYSFATSDTSYMGMSIYDDKNDNGIVDASYDIDPTDPVMIWEGESVIGETNETTGTDPYEYNTTESELQYTLFFESVEDVAWSEPVITETDAEFSITLQNVELMAYPYASSYDWFMMNDGLLGEENSTAVSCYLEYLTVNFYYSGTESGSSVSIKHDIPQFTDAAGLPLDAFDGLSLTIDYYVYSDQYTELMDVGNEVSVESGEFKDSQDSLGEVSMAHDGENMMEMNFVMPYTWGADGQEYENTVAIMPIYGYDVAYGDMELGQASTFSSEYRSQMSYYSMCFNWGGESILMDPTFISLYTDLDISDLFNISSASGVMVILVGSFMSLGLVYRYRKQH